ncbi:hypothetical protein DYH09_25580 [bacterium CPR1]|nr:hypothetical protein [bacterium CPR1]
MFSLELDKHEYDPRQIVRGVFRFALESARPNLRVAVGLTATREGEMVYETSRTLDGPRELASGNYAFELRLPEDVKGPGLFKRLKQAIGRAASAPVKWEVWGILDREIVCKRAFEVVLEEEDDEPAEAPPARSSVLSRLNLEPPDYAPSGRLEEAPARKKPAPAKRADQPAEPSELPRRTVFCPSCGAREEDAESDYCGRCGKALH